MLQLFEGLDPPKYPHAFWWLVDLVIPTIAGWVGYSKWEVALPSGELNL